MTTEGSERALRESEEAAASGERKSIEEHQTMGWGVMPIDSEPQRRSNIIARTKDAAAGAVARKVAKLFFG